MNRITSAEEKTGTTVNWNQTYTFDRYGNRNFNESLTTTLPKGCMDGSTPVVCEADKKMLDPALDPANNKMASGQDWSYDAAGNVIGDPQGRTFIYDAENKQVEVENSLEQSIGKYWFDGDGKRIKKEGIAPNGQPELTVFVYDAGGKLIGEYSTNVETAAPKVQYLTADHLGSPRINTDQNGTVTSRTDYMPYGEEITALDGRTASDAYTPDNIRKGFTGYETDEETGLEYAQARYYLPQLGRFNTADPILDSIEATFPQTLNRYSYSLNQPITIVDPSGEKWEFVSEHLKDAFESAVKALGRKAWNGYQKLERQKGVIKVGFAELEPKKVGESLVRAEVINREVIVEGSILLSTNAKTLDQSNATDLAVASGHEYTHFMSALAGFGLPDFVGLAPKDTTTPDQTKEGLVNFGVETAAFDAEQKVEAAMIKNGGKRVTPGTEMDAGMRNYGKKLTAGDKYDYLTSIGYKFVEPRPADPRPVKPRPSRQSIPSIRRKRGQ